MNITYLRRMRQDDWHVLRRQTLERDGYRCQVWLAHEATEVHHRTYERFGHEELADLISLCRSCHKAITTVVRAERYRRRRFAVQPIERLTPALLREVMTQALTPVDAPRRIG